jgi:ankyrin repeat protein
LYTPLHWAAREGGLDLVKLLLEKGANPNAVSELNETPLHVAAGKGYMEARRRGTRYYRAAREGGLGLVKLLVEKGANPNAVNKSNDTPLHKAGKNRGS